MKNRDILLERLSDVKNLDEHPWFPGEYISLDLALLYPGGQLP